MTFHDRSSIFLLALYQAAADCPGETFQDRALALLDGLLPFDSAWWVTSSFQGRRHEVHSSFLCRLPREFIPLWQQAQKGDVVLHSCLPKPWESQSFSAEQLNHSRESRAIQELTGIHHALATTALDERGLPVATGISLYRHSNAPFSDSEKRLKQCLMPHMINAHKINQKQQLSRFYSPLCCAALVDSMGLVHAIDPGCDEALRREWPEWQGGYLPHTLWQALREKRESRGRCITVRSVANGDMLMIVTQESSQLQGLTAKEREVAELFANGYSYKEVARLLNMSPATTRHHLRTIYRKLDINDKVELIGRMTEGGRHIAPVLRIDAGIPTKAQQQKLPTKQGHSFCEPRRGPAS